MRRVFGGLNVVVNTPVKIRFVYCNEVNFLICLKHGVWGSVKDRFSSWEPDEHIVFLVDKAIAGVAIVVGEQTTSSKSLWPNEEYPYRITIKFTRAYLKDNRPRILGSIKDALIKVWELSYGLRIINQEVFPDYRLAEEIISQIYAIPDDMEALSKDIDANLEDAISKSKIKAKKSDVKQSVFIEPHKHEDRRGTRIAEKVEMVRSDESEDAIFPDSSHSRAQSVLISLGEIVGCKSWIAANDKNRVYNGETLGANCLSKLPGMGLNEEACKRISLIDVIWVKQNAPVAAFEVETSTSVYSGLLRMSDLLSVVPALQLKLYIVAPKERQKKVMSELARPTFQKIGLCDYCKFIPLEELEKRLDKVSDLKGHVQPSIIDSVAIGLDEQET